MKSFKSAIVVLSLLCVFISAGQAQASAFLSLKPGESTIREFVLYNAFSPKKFGPVEVYGLMGQGTDAIPMGDLTITIKPTVTKEFGAVVNYSLLGVAYTLADITKPLGGTPTVINVAATAPLTLTNVVKMDIQNAILILAVYIKDINGDVQLPVQFSITFAWAAGKAIVTTTTTTVASTATAE